MTNLENRVWRLEIELRQAQQLVRELQVALGAVKQNQFAGSPGYGGGGGGGGNPLFCVLSGALAASGTIGTGTPGGPLTGQTVYSISGGAYASVSTTASVLNGLPNAIASGAKCIVEANGDGSYSAIAVAC